MNYKIPLKYKNWRTDLDPFAPSVKKRILPEEPKTHEQILQESLLNDKLEKLKV